MTPESIGAGISNKIAWETKFSKKFPAFGRSSLELAK